MVTFNRSINLEAAALIADEYGAKVEVAVGGSRRFARRSSQHGGEEHLQPRPPVVRSWVMSSTENLVLDAILVTKVAGRGSAWNHAAYRRIHGECPWERVDLSTRRAMRPLTAMRARGAEATDIVARWSWLPMDGVMRSDRGSHQPCQSRGGPPCGCDQQDRRIVPIQSGSKRLSEHGLIPEAWGGETIIVEVSAKRRSGLKPNCWR